MWLQINPSFGVSQFLSHMRQSSVRVDPWPARRPEWNTWLAMSLETGDGSRLSFRFLESEPPTPKNGTGRNARPHPSPFPQERTPRTLCAPCALEPTHGPLTPCLSPSEGERVPEGRGRRRFMGREQPPPGAC